MRWWFLGIPGLLFTVWAVDCIAGGTAAGVIGAALIIAGAIGFGLYSMANARIASAAILRSDDLAQQVIRQFNAGPRPGLPPAAPASQPATQQPWAPPQRSSGPAIDVVTVSERQCYYCGQVRPTTDFLGYPICGECKAKT